MGARSFCPSSRQQVIESESPRSEDERVASEPHEAECREHGPQCSVERLEEHCHQHGADHEEGERTREQAGQEEHTSCAFSERSHPRQGCRELRKSPPNAAASSGNRNATSKNPRFFSAGDHGRPNFEKSGFQFVAAHPAFPCAERSVVSHHFEWSGLRADVLRSVARSTQGPPIRHQGRTSGAGSCRSQRASARSMACDRSVRPRAASSGTSGG